MNDQIPTCDWSQDCDGEMWSTDCGKAFVLNEGPPHEHQMKFCCFCGRALHETPYVDDVRDEHDEEYIAELTAKQANESTK